MGVKILLADDSPTVHKVIKIILASEPYEVVECSREGDLLPKLAQHSPAIVFLDFNFSENLTGYDLCRSIKERNPNVKVLMMYGTFDAIDESILADCGADQHVVKPFDTNRFVFQVRALADKTKSEPADDWNVRDTVEMSSVESDFSAAAPVESLGDTLSDWGMMIPGVIGKADGSLELPPVIADGETHSDIDEYKAPTVEAKSPLVANLGPAVPDDRDLEYPDMGASLELDSAEPAAGKPKSRLIALNELATDIEEEKSNNSLELMAYTGMEAEGIKKIEDQIRDEVEADLWSVDSFEEVNSRLAVVKESHSSEEDDYSFTAAPAPQVSSKASRAPAPEGNITMDLESLRPMLEEMIKLAVRDYCEKHVDKVAWEIIPDLAENLIKKELQDLARKAAED